MAASRRCTKAFRSLLNSRPSTHVPSFTSSTCTAQRRTVLAGKPSQIRCYAVPQPRRASPSYAEVFNLAEIPLSSFETIIARNGDSFRRFKPAEYYECAQKFSEAIKRGSNPWSITLIGSHMFKEEGFSSEVIHETACIMRQIQGPRSADAFATTLWASASEAGYRPSTLSLARQLIRSGAYGHMPQLRKVEARFRQLVSTAKDPDALTAEGELLFEQGNCEAAIRVLQRALQVGASGFEWKPYCQLCLGRAYLKAQRRDEARAVFESLSESGLVEADIELGDMLRTNDKDAAERHLFLAASNGRSDMFGHLSEMALERASGAGDDKKSRKESLRWAQEWSRLGDPRVEY